MLFAGSAGAGIVAANLGTRSAELLNRRVMVVVIAVGTMHVAGMTVVMVVAVAVIAVGPVDVLHGGGLSVGGIGGHVLLALLGKSQGGL